MNKAFKLQPVLNYRGLLEQEAQQALAQSLRRRNEAQAQLNLERAELDSQLATLEHKKQVGIQIRELNLYQSNIQHRQQIVADLEKCLVRIDGEVEDKRKALTKTCQDRQVLETLKTKQQAAYRKESLRKETALMDEIGLRFGDNQS